MNFWMNLETNSFRNLEFLDEPFLQFYYVVEIFSVITAGVVDLSNFRQFCNCGVQCYLLIDKHYFEDQHKLFSK